LPEERQDLVAGRDGRLAGRVDPLTLQVEIDRSEILGRAGRRARQAREGIRYRDGHRCEICAQTPRRADPPAKRAGVTRG